MSRPDGGILVPVVDLTESFVGLKVRTVGFLTEYKAHTGKGQLTSGRGEVCVDLNLVIQGTALGKLSLQPKVMVIGSVEMGQASKAPTLVAICLIPVQDLDFPIWEQAARQLSLALQASTAS